jgi:hypothetical protein
MATLLCKKYALRVRQPIRIIYGSRKEVLEAIQHSRELAARDEKIAELKVSARREARAGME